MFAVHCRMSSAIGRLLQLANQLGESRREYDEVTSVERLVRVRNAGRDKDGPARAHVDLMILEAEMKHTVEDVPRFVVRVMDVQLRTGVPCAFGVTFWSLTIRQACDAARAATEGR